MDTNYLEAQGWLTKDERELLKELAAKVPEGGTIINVGVEYGASLHCLREGNPSARLIGIDIIGDEKLVGDSGAVIIKGDSGKVALGWDKGVIDLAFIDGDHSEQGVHRDTFFAKHLTPGGVIAFHDCYAWPPAPPKTVHPICPGVNRAVQKFYENNSRFLVEQEHVDTTRYFVRV